MKFTDLLIIAHRHHLKSALITLFSNPENYSGITIIGPESIPENVESLLQLLELFPTIGIYRGNTISTNLPRQPLASDNQPFASYPSESD